MGFNNLERRINKLDDKLNEMDSKTDSIIKLLKRKELENNRQLLLDVTTDAIY